MPEQIFIGNFAKGQTTNRLPFVIDNDAFPTLYNFYSWRGRVKRKRGTVGLGRLQVQLELASSPSNYQKASLTLSGGAANLISTYSLVSTASIAPGSINLTTTADSQLYTEPTVPDGTLSGSLGGSGTINYATGALTIVGGGTGTVIGDFSYFPGLPVMGLEDFNASNSSSQYPLLLAFDTDFSYQLNQTTSVVNFYNTTYYKTTATPFIWSGQDYQQFWTTNDSGALWASNNKSGFNFVSASYTSGSGSTAVTFNFISGANPFQNLIIGDVVWFNEWTGGSTINGITGTVSDISGAAMGNYVVTFTSSQTVSGTGIAQLLTNTIPGQDGIKWYDGDPTSGTGIPTGTGLGWVNFAPPLTATSVSINNTPAALYYLVGALAIVPFKDRILFFSPYIQSSNGSVIQLQNTVIWSWNGTPYYTNPTPTNNTSNVSAYYVDQTGKGGFLSAGISDPIATVSTNEDVLLVGFGGKGRKTRFVYTGNDLQPFLFFVINSELPSSSTFSSITMDDGAIDLGVYGIAMTDQQSSRRIDLEIPDNVFQIQNLNNGFARVNAQRDFQKEWIYFSYPVNTSLWRFPTQTFLLNYRDNTWAVFYENYTVHGNYRKQMKYTWQTLPFKTWSQWREPWNSGTTSPLVANIIAGNPQGFVVIKGEGTGEGQSGNIAAIVSDAGQTKINSIDHCVAVGDYLYVQNALGVTGLNNIVARVISITDADYFTIDVPFPTGTYLGLGTFSRLSQPLLQTKQFPVYWGEGRKTRLSVQKYLMDTTSTGQVTVNVYLSQNPDDVWNGGPVVPMPDPDNSALVYSQLMYTCPESANIGLSAPNTNLQMPTAPSQFQIWHRFNTSLIGDSIQIGITLNDAQMRDINLATNEVVLQGMHLITEKGPHLS